MSEQDMPEAAESQPDTAVQGGDTPSQGAPTPPDRLAIDPASPFFDETVLRRGVGIRFKGTVRTNIEEYCIPESWVRVQAGKAMDRKGRPLTLKLNGPVEAWFEDLGEGASVNKL